MWAQGGDEQGFHQPRLPGRASYGSGSFKEICRGVMPTEKLLKVFPKIPVGSFIQDLKGRYLSIPQRGFITPFRAFSCHYPYQ